jgi:hypothetical protein
MSLREVRPDGGMYEVTRGSFHYPKDFDLLWARLSRRAQAGVLAEINRRLQDQIDHPTRWGALTNTTIEGGRVNPHNGVRGDWSDTPLDPLYEACSENEQLSGQFFGVVFKWVVIDRPERWVGYRSDPTFPTKDQTLQGKSYFLAEDAS